MDQTHLHLVITHLPIFGSIIGACILGYGLWTKSTQTQMAAYLLFVGSALGAGLAYYTGEGAEEVVENIQGVTESIIKEHEEFALYALISLIVLGVLSLLTLIITYKKSSLAKTAAYTTLLVSLVSFALVAQTGYLGGKIRHTELNGIAPAGGNVQEQGADEDDD